MSSPSSVAAVGSRGSTRPLWTVLVAGSCITAISLGVRSTFGLFLAPMTAALHTNRAGFALAIAIQNLVWGVGQPIAGACADRFGPGRVLVTGGLAYASGVLLMSRAATTTGFYLGGGVVVGIGLAAASFAVVLASVGRLAPPERRTWALGVATAAGSCGQFILVQVVSRLQGSFGWRSALVAMAAVAATILVCIWPLRGLPKVALEDGAVPEETLRDALSRASRCPSYVMLNAGFFVCGFHVTFIGTHLPSYLKDVGLGGSGARALALIGLFNIVGSFGAGILGSRHSRPRLLSIIYAARSLAIVGLLLAPRSGLTVAIFAMVMGVLWLSTVPLTSGIVVNQFGITHAGSLFGIVFLSHQLGAFVGVWYGGKLADAAGSYNPVWWIAAALGVFGAFIHLFIKDEPAPPAPLRVAGAGVGLRPAAGMASVVVAVGLAGYGAALRSTERAETEPATPSALTCPLHSSF